MDLEPVHPGEILSRDFLAPMGLNSRKICDILGIERIELKKLKRGELDIDRGMAEQLGNILRTGAEFWIKLQKEYDRRLNAKLRQERLDEARKKLGIDHAIGIPFEPRSKEISKGEDDEYGL